MIAATCFAADPASVLQAARVAAGGDAWNGVRALHIHAQLQAGGRSGASDRWEDVRTGRLVKEYRLPPKTGADGFDGVAVWTQPQNGIAYVLGDEDARLGAINDSFRAARAWWFPQRRQATMEDAGIRTEGARTFDLVRMTPEAGRALVLWVDRGTHLIDRVVEQRAEQTSVTRYADYRWVDGLRLPFTISSGDGDSAYDDVETVERIDINPEIADRRFSIPPLPSAPSTAVETVTVPFRLEDNRIFLDVSINGQGPFDAEFDSGGSLVIPPEVLSDLNLAATGHSKQTGGGEGFVTAARGNVATMSIGGAVVMNPGFQSFAWDDEEPRRLLIGLEVLQQFVVHIDFDRLTLTLAPPTSYSYTGTGSVLPFHFQDNQPEIGGSIDGIAAFLTVDTGDNGSLLLTAPFASKYGLEERYRATIPYAGSAAGVTGGVWARVGDVTLNGADGRPLVHVDRPVTRISKQQSGFDAHRYVSANLGIGVLKQFSITFDYTRQRLILEPNHLYGLPDVFDRSGMRLENEGSGWRVMALVPGAAAARAGLRVGDMIVAIDGKTRPQLNRAALKAVLRSPARTFVALRILRESVELKSTLTLGDVL
jgi:predicted aspartyl protease